MSSETERVILNFKEKLHVPPQFLDISPKTCGQRMAQGQGISSMPLPPMQYVSMYTDENVKRGRAPRPPPPIKDTYTVFGSTYQADGAIIAPLESQGLRRLYPTHYDHKRELRKLNHSILINFLDLLDILIKSPDSPKRTEKMEDLQLLYIHMHHLINEYRPHQARETLRVMMDVQKRQRLETAERFQKHLEKVQELLSSCISSLPEDCSLDTKLLVKMEPMDDMDTHQNGLDQEELGCSTQDQMMCDIVDALN